RNLALRAADTPDGLEYKSRYASLQIRSFEKGIVVEAMNEKGLQGSVLFLDGSELPAVQPGRDNIDPNNFIAYAVSSFSNVRELVDSLARINFIPATLDIPGPEGEGLGYPADKWPGHFAFSDASGDKVIIEFIKGEVKVYHGREHDALTNEPNYETHLALDAVGYQPTGSIFPEDRRGRAKSYLRDMRERGVDEPRRALLAMRGLLAGVWAGTEEIDRVENEVYPTIWSSLADQKSLTYYITRYNTWCSEIYDFSMFDAARPEEVTLTAPDYPYAKIDGSPLKD
ncbi:linear amide C-N hydrolase, partial [Deltaproteobacteria bacterium OttesenSCG-928-K17]|nr:linear amide C-N hydrolase [Deltaproteobacteria bacterium OttesenSCG-928-K17]